MVAVHGGGYCASAALAAKTVVTNALRVAGVDTFAVILIWLGKARPPTRSPRNALGNCPSGDSSS